MDRRGELPKLAAVGGVERGRGIQGAEERWWMMLIDVKWYFSFLGASNNIYILAESPRYYLDTVLYIWIKLVDFVLGSDQYTETDCFEVRPEEP